MKPNKIKALLHQVESGKLKGDLSIILFLIKEKEMGIDDLLKRGFVIQTASARLSDLENAGLIRKINTTDRFSKYRFIELESERKSFVDELARKKANAFFVKGFENGYLEFSKKFNCYISTQTINQ